ncbi:hypothetical protein R1flu_015267 [Riccia fluitans]|uniref:Uncharacterized protein n=1 Tax=Riccia fluitans TaxID=41844 RepID=A0ABD1YIH6_9MARC
MQKEQEEMKKVAEVLEKRKQERARLAAYIHVHPVKGSTINSPKSFKNENKRTRWKSFLMEDQEVIMKFREKTAITHNSYYHQKKNHPNALADNILKGSERVQPCGAYTNSYMKGYHAPDQNFAAMGSKYMDDTTTYESYDHLNKYPFDRYHDLDTDQCSEVSAAKFSIKSEPIRQIAWAPDIPTYASMVGETQRETTMQSKRYGVNTLMKEDGLPKVVHSTISQTAEQEKRNLVTKRAETYGEAYMTTSNSDIRGDESCSAEHNSNLKEEILKARQANEQETARLIAKADAIESHLESCNLSLRPLDFREAEPDGETQEQLLERNDTLSVSLDETDSNFSTEETLTGLFSERSARTDQIINTTSTSDPQLSTEIDWTSMTVGSTKCPEMKMVNLEIKSGVQEYAKSEETHQGLRNKVILDYASTKHSVEINGSIHSESNTETKIPGFQITKEAHAHHKMVTASGDPKLETNISWDINWDTPTKHIPRKKPSFDCLQSSQMISHSCIPRPPAKDEWKIPVTKQRMIKTEYAAIDNLKEERQGFESCCRHPLVGLERDGDMFHGQEEDNISSLPLHHVGFSQPIYKTYPQEERTPQGNTMLSGRGSGFTGDKKTHQNFHTGALIEEEDKIFASLERLDWKLAALQSRSVSTGRVSFVSQGEFSTKSAPAVMGPAIRKQGLAGLQSAKKTLPYSTVPPRPLVCSSCQKL